MNPERLKYKWKIDEINENNYCSIIIYETTLSSDLLREAVEHIRNNYSIITSILVAICYSEDKTNLKGIMEMEDYYKEKYKLDIIRTM